MRCGQGGLLWSSLCENRNLMLKVGERVENLEAASHVIRECHQCPRFCMSLIFPLGGKLLELFPPCNIHTQISNHTDFPWGKKKFQNKGFFTLSQYSSSSRCHSNAGCSFVLMQVFVVLCSVQVNTYFAESIGYKCEVELQVITAFPYIKKENWIPMFFFTL